MSDHWEYYFALIEKQPASIFVDVGVRDVAPDRTREHLYWVLISLNHPTPDGLITDWESEAFWEIEGRLGRACDSIGTLPVGRITTAGRRELYYYGPPKADFKSSVRSVLRRFPRYSHEVDGEPDPSWSHYLNFLYPEPEAQRTIENRKVIQALHRAGDVITMPRPVTHYIYFESEQGRDQFIDAALPLRFHAEPTVAEGTKRPYGLALERTETVEPFAIDATVVDLYRQAIEFDGEYDGWESPVVTRPQHPGFWQRLFGKRG